MVAPSAFCTKTSPGLRRTALRQIERDVRRKRPILGLMVGDDLRHQRVDGKAVAGEADRRLRHLAEAHGAEALERRDPGIGRRRHHGAQDALRNLAAVVLLEVVALDRLRPGAETRDRDDAILGGGIDDDRRHAREVHDIPAARHPVRCRRRRLRRSHCRPPPESGSRPRPRGTGRRRPCGASP